MTQEEKDQFAVLVQKLQQLPRTEYEDTLMYAGFQVDEDNEGQVIIYTDKY
ncbi:MAG: hypothetical protein ABFD50_04650 [Smithella sp.]